MFNVILEKFYFPFPFARPSLSRKCNLCHVTPPQMKTLVIISTAEIFCFELYYYLHENWRVLQSVL